MTEDRDTLLIDDCGCGCDCNNTALVADSQPDVLLIDESEEWYESAISKILEIVQSLQITTGGTNVINNITNNIKEIIPILTYSATAPNFPEEGSYYINSTEEKLYKFTSGAWVEEAPKVGLIYTSVDTSHIYLWNGYNFVDATSRISQNIFYGARKKPHLDVAFFGDVYNNDSHELGYEGAGRILVRDKNNAIQDDDYIILYYWDRRNHRIAAFAGGNGDKKIYPVRWGTLPYKSWRHRDKGWKDDWRELPYKMSDIMQRITYLTPEEFNDLMWEGGYLKKTLLGTMSFVGGPRGNGYSTKLWIGVARGVSYNVGLYGMNYAHFVVEDLMHRIPFYLRCLHKPDQVTENNETTYVQGHVKYSCSHSRKPHLDFKNELDQWTPNDNE